MKAIIHQPYFLPYPGFFHKLSLGDIFVIMDDVQYDKRFTNRNRIVKQNGWSWITVPINKNDKFSPNMEVRINNELNWKELHWKKISQTYANSEYFHLYKDYFEKLYKRDWEYLFDLDFEIVKQVLMWLGIKIDIVRESELGVNTTSTQRLIDVCHKIGADTYVSGSGGRQYMDESLFKKNNVKLIYQDYKFTKYQQKWTNEFIPDLSIIDLLANIGPDSMKVISGELISDKT